MRVLLVADESAGVQMLRTLHASEHDLVAVMASPSRREGVTVWDPAQQLGHETWPAREVKKPALAERIQTASVDLLLNVHSLHVIREEVVSAPGIGSFNIHPGPLPRYAGLNVPSWAIYRGEARHGVTIHRMLAGIDTGPIAYQEMFDVSPEATGLSVSLECIRRGVPLLQRLLHQAATDPAGIPAIEQDLSQREYFGKEIPGGGRLEWNQPAAVVHALIRACNYYPFPSPWGAPKACLGGLNLGVANTRLTGYPPTSRRGRWAKQSRVEFGSLARMSGSRFNASSETVKSSRQLRRFDGRNE